MAAITLAQDAVSPRENQDPDVFWIYILFFAALGVGSVWVGIQAALNQ